MVGFGFILCICYAFALFVILFNNCCFNSVVCWLLVVLLVCGLCFTCWFCFCFLPLLFMFVWIVVVSVLLVGCFWLVVCIVVLIAYCCLQFSGLCCWLVGFIMFDCFLLLVGVYVYSMLIVCGVFDLLVGGLFLMFGCLNVLLWWRLVCVWDCLF